MPIKKILLPLITTFVVVYSNVVNADNGVIFPPSMSSQNYQFPPQMPTTPMLNSASPQVSNPYVFGRSNVVQPRMAAPVPPAVMNRFPVNQFPPTARYRQPVPKYGTQGGRYPNASVRGINPRYMSSNNGYPFGNTNNRFNPFSSNTMPFGNNGSNSFNPFTSNNFSNPMTNMFGNNSNNNFPFFGNTSNKKRKKAWGTERNIWPDFYTDFTDDAWDTMMGGPRDLGEMPGGWHFPYLSTPDPVTVSDAITNQFPPIMEEGGNMMDFSDWGVFD